jgi:hypothetical protein
MATWRHKKNDDDDIIVLSDSESPVSQPKKSNFAHKRTTINLKIDDDIEIIDEVKADDFYIVRDPDFYIVEGLFDFKYIIFIF